MLRVVLDTNVLVSALGWGGKAEQIFLSGIKGKFIILESKILFNEFDRTISLSKFNFISAEKKIEFLNLVIEFAKIIEPAHQLKLIFEDDADNRVLECALSGNADYIVSGDKHLLRLKSLGKIKIVNPSNFFNIIRAK